MGEGGILPELAPAPRIRVSTAETCKTWAGDLGKTLHAVCGFGDDRYPGVSIGRSLVPPFDPPRRTMEITAFVPINTSRLVLRRFDPDDVEDLYVYQGLSSVARYLYRPPHTRERCEMVIAERVSSTAWIRDGDKVALAICRHEQPGVMGEVTLTLASAHARQAEIGWVLNPEYEKCGYATEAARAVAALAFDVLGVHRLFARLDAENADSVRLCERLGMRREAYLVENDLDGERWGSEYMYAALAKDLKR